MKVKGMAWALLLTVALAVWLTHRLYAASKQPVHDGKPLLTWLEEANVHFHPMASPVSTNSGVDAVRQIGTNAIPALLKLLTSDYMPLARRLELFLRMAPPRKYESNWRLQLLACCGFACLGSKGEPALGELKKLLEDKRSSVRSAAAISIGYIGIERSEITSCLLARLQDEDFDTQLSAVWALGELKANAPAVVPVLIQRLDSLGPDAPLVPAIILALSQYGSAASPARASLVRLAASDNYTARWAASNALSELAFDYTKTSTNSPGPGRGK